MNLYKTAKKLKVLKLKSWKTCKKSFSGFKVFKINNHTAILKLDIIVFREHRVQYQVIIFQLES